MCCRPQSGPFTEPPLPAFIVNPLGAVPKKHSGKWRLIMHLSFPPGTSINDRINISDFPLRYSTVYDTVMRLGRHALMAKVDVQNAFHLCPVHPSEYHFLSYQWQGQFFYDQVLPFSLRFAPYVLNCLAEAIEWLVRQKGITEVHHYLDNFFVAGAPHTCSSKCANHLHRLTSLCNHLNIPLAEDKQEGPTTQFEYLGILLDSAALKARLPADKLAALKTSLALWTQRSQCSKQELLSLICTLSFAAKIVPAGRTFLCRMIDLSTTTPRLRDIIPLDDGFKCDLRWWSAFATPWLGRSFFLLLHWTPAPDLYLYTDSAGPIGYGAYYDSEWFNSRWSPDQATHSNQYKELYPIVLAALVWGHQWVTVKVCFHCDNLAIVSCLTSGSSQCPHIMHLLRNLFLIAATHNFSVSTQHVPGTHNAIADSLSRFQMQLFRRLAQEAAPHPTPTPPSLPLRQI